MGVEDIADPSNLSEKARYLPTIQDGSDQYLAYFEAFGGTTNTKI